MSPPNEVTRILLDWNRDPKAALEKLTPLVYDRLRRLAASILRGERQDHTLQPTALVHEAYLSLAGQGSMAWKDRGHFFAVAARAMRLILVDSARRHYSQKRGSGRKVQLEDEIVYSESRIEEFLDLNDSIEALKAWDERKCAVLELKYFGGLEREHVADVLGISVGKVKSELALDESY